MWTIDELVDRVRAALAAEYPGAPNGRVRDVPDRRAIRWYTTTGLVDRPAAMRGRTALYGPRHLLQLVALKRRQATGRSLAEIQAELAGATDHTLLDIARVPPGFVTVDEGALRHAQAPGPARERFWAAPAPDAPAGPGLPGPTARPATTNADARSKTTGPEASRTTADGAAGVAEAPGGAVRPARTFDSVTPRRWSLATAADSHPAPVPLAGVGLGDGVVLLLPGAPDAGDYADIAAAARPLLDLLATRGLTAAGSPHRLTDRPATAQAQAPRTDRSPA